MTRRRHDRHGYRDTRRGGSHRYGSGRRNHRASGGIHWTTIAIWIILIIAIGNGMINISGN